MDILHFISCRKWRIHSLVLKVAIIFHLWQKANEITRVATGIGFVLPDKWIIKYFKIDGTQIRDVELNAEVTVNVENNTSYVFKISGMTLLAYAKVYEPFITPRIRVVDYFSETATLCDESKPCSSQDAIVNEHQ